MPTLEDSPRLKIGLLVGGTIAFQIVACVVVLAFDLRVDTLAQVGTALAPIVGALSLAAVLAALGSLDLQRVAFDEQRAAMNRDLEVQRQAVKLQADGLEAQQKALQTEITMQRHAALAVAYARLFGAVDAYRAEVLTYLRWIDKNSSDKEARRAERHSLEPVTPWSCPVLGTRSASSRRGGSKPTYRTR